MTSIALAVWLVFSPAHAADLTGVPRIVDGDTLAIGSTKVRLQGIDAPETDQVCLNANGVRWTCGIDARDQLVMHVAGREISTPPCDHVSWSPPRHVHSPVYLQGATLGVPPSSDIDARCAPGSGITDPEMSLMGSYALDEFLEETITNMQHWCPRLDGLENN